MSKAYNSDLQLNNERIQALINKANSLPEAGSTGGEGDTSMEDGIVTRELTEYSNDRITSIGTGAFQSCVNLTTANFSNCIIIQSSAFYNCIKLTTISFPNVTSIASSAFCNCAITMANFPNCTNIDTGAFNMCAYLTVASFPNVTIIGGSAFDNCRRLISLNFPKVNTIKSSAFRNCSQLTLANFSNLTSIGSYAFHLCYNLSSLTLGASTICTLSNSNAFSYTPFAGYSSYFSGTPVIYVPTSLLSRYKTATNWTYFSKYMVGY